MEVKSHCSSFTEIPMKSEFSMRVFVFSEFLQSALGEMNTSISNARLRDENMFIDSRP
jgi:hypothetical protein